MDDGVLLLEKLEATLIDDDDDHVQIPTPFLDVENTLFTSTSLVKVGQSMGSCVPLCFRASSPP